MQGSQCVGNPHRGFQRADRAGRDSGKWCSRYAQHLSFRIQNYGFGQKKKIQVWLGHCSQSFSSIPLHLKISGTGVFKERVLYPWAVKQDNILIILTHEVRDVVFKKKKKKYLLHGLSYTALHEFSWFHNLYSYGLSDFWLPALSLHYFIDLYGVLQICIVQFACLLQLF